MVRWLLAVSSGIFDRVTTVRSITDFRLKVPLLHSGYPPQTSVTEVKHRSLRIVRGWGPKWLIKFHKSKS